MPTPRRFITQTSYMIAVAIVALVFAAAQAHAAPSNSATAKVKRTKAKAEDYFSAGVSLGLATSLHTRVATLKKRFPVYAGGDLDIIGIGLFGLGPAASVAVHFPLKSIVTPTVGASVGFVYLTGVNILGITAAIKPGVLIEIDKGIDIDFQLRMGMYGGFFLPFPTFGMRFAI